ncbi:hypothetical protein DL96DRAFT_1756458 [Flagelloscypha sp. PMI_526]|nr:hypothetical protein DL96DRAFT_1756458 [Flagelloscypha sp. PMI_526]
MSPLLTASLLSQSDSITVYKAQTERGRSVTRTTEDYSYLDSPVTKTLHGSTSTIVNTKITVTTTEVTTKIKSTSYQAIPTYSNYTLVIPFDPAEDADDRIEVSSNWTHVVHSWYHIHGIYHYHDCNLANKTCQYWKTFGGATMDYVSYTGKVVPFLVISGTESASSQSSNDAKNLRIVGWLILLQLVTASVFRASLTSLKRL